MAQEINLTLTGYRADEVLPEESGDYAVLQEYGIRDHELTTLCYSAKHRAWNARDYQTEEFVEQYRINNVTHWFRLPEAPALQA